MEQLLHQAESSKINLKSQREPGRSGTLIPINYFLLIQFSMAKEITSAVIWGLGPQKNSEEVDVALNQHFWEASFEILL